MAAEHPCLSTPTGPQPHPGLRRYALRTPLLCLACMAALSPARAQQEILLRGTVYDSTRMITVPAVKVSSTGGGLAYTDSVGQYRILVMPRDSVSFSYRGKTTAWFPVRDIKYTQGFDISLQITVNDRYKTLKEVIVIARSYRQDSLENRERYRKVFEFENGLAINEGGIDPNSIINLFRVRRNRSMRSFQNRLLAEEAEKFVNYRFNKTMVKNLTGLEGVDLDRFMTAYRPTYDFTAASTEYEFYQYTLEASRLFRSGAMPPRAFWEVMENPPYLRR